MKPDIIHSHWFVPAGLVGHITSVFTGIPHVVSVYSDGFLIKTNPILRLVARIIFNRAKSVIAISKSIKEYVDLIYPDAEVGMMGVFCALDFFLFYLFWEIMLVPMYFLIGVWGGPRREYAAIKFFLYTLFGSVFMLIGILAIIRHL